MPGRGSCLGRHCSGPLCRRLLALPPRALPLPAHVGSDRRCGDHYACYLHGHVRGWVMRGTYSAAFGKLHVAAAAAAACGPTHLEGCLYGGCAEDDGRLSYGEHQASTHEHRHRGRAQLERGQLQVPRVSGGGAHELRWMVGGAWAFAGWGADDDGARSVSERGAGSGHLRRHATTPPSTSLLPSALLKES